MKLAIIIMVFEMDNDCTSSDLRRTARALSFNVLLFVFSIFFLSSCKRIECGKYDRFISDGRDREKLLSWVDANIFDRTFRDDELRGGELIGPGRRFKSIFMERSNIVVPGWLSGYEVRILGPDQYKPDAVFIGARSFKGLVVTRGELLSSLQGTDVKPEWLDRIEKRVATMCYIEK